MRRRAFIAILVAAPATCVLAVLLINLRWFDEPLLPELEALLKPQPRTPEGNAFPYALGFLAAEDREPRAAGMQIIAVLQAQRDRGEPATIGMEERLGILGGPLATDGLGGISRPVTEPSAATTSLDQKCLPRYRLDCAQQLIANVASLDPSQPPLATLFARYENLLRQAHYVEIPAPDPLTPWPPLGVIQEVGRVRLAMSFRTDSTAVFLEKASQELRFWRIALREGQLLGTKMSALAAIRWAHDFLSTMLRERELDARELEQLRDFLHPLTAEESNIGDAFLSESRIALLGGQPSVTAEASWPVRLLLQKNATFNQEYRETIEPMRQRSSLDASEYYARKAHEPLRHELRLSPGMLYNLGGKLALSRSTWDVHQFQSRVHDEQGRITLLLLAAELEEHPDQDVATLISTSSLRNPYTGEPMEYDALSGTIGFSCLHTAHHPPEPADRCLVALGQRAP
ncbi:MAG TPA: hypothetical protein VFV88_05070 [Steroidobacteraceae bacterium]|nr:hypothetical protein [Steroidobacteraceae bacterium]